MNNYALNTDHLRAWRKGQKRAIKLDVICCPDLFEKTKNPAIYITKNFS